MKILFRTEEVKRLEVTKKKTTRLPKHHLQDFKRQFCFSNVALSQGLCMYTKISARHVHMTHRCATLTAFVLILSTEFALK